MLLTLRPASVAGFLHSLDICWKRLRPTASPNYLVEDSSSPSLSTCSSAPSAG